MYFITFFNILAHQLPISIPHDMEEVVIDGEDTFPEDG